jgi:hypothetical protein
LETAGPTSLSQLVSPGLSSKVKAQEILDEGSPKNANLSSLPTERAANQIFDTKSANTETGLVQKINQTVNDIKSLKKFLLSKGKQAIDHNKITS